MGGLIPAADVSKNGLMTPSQVKSLAFTSVIKGLPGGRPTTWFKIGTFMSNSYSPILFDGAIGTFQEVSMNYFKFRITIYNNSVNYSKEYMPTNVFGYTIDGENATFYIKLTSTQSIIMQIRGGLIISLSDEETSSEPAGITYLE